MRKTESDPALEIRKALTETTRSIAKDDSLDVSFTSEPPGLADNVVMLPNVGRSISREEATLLRGLADGFALRYRFHDSLTHRRYLPDGDEAREMYEALETVRCEQSARAQCQERPPILTHA